MLARHCTADSSPPYVYTQTSRYQLAARLLLAACTGDERVVVLALRAKTYLPVRYIAGSTG